MSTLRILGMDGLNRKRRIRAGHRGVATKRIHELEGLLTGGDRPDPQRLAQLKLSLQEKHSALRQLDNEILELIEGEADITKDIDESDSFNQTIYEALVKIERHGEGPSIATPTSGMGIGTTRDPGMSRGSTGTRARLPKLSLRPFDGDLTKWMTFWDSYEAAIHKNTELTDIDKFTYLRSLVERSAKESISGLALTSANYNEAITILEKRFGNKQRIISRHMDVLLDVEGVTSQHNLTALRRLYDRVESHIRGLRALGVAPDSYGSLLLPVLVKKLPHELQLIVSRKVPDEHWNVDTFMKVLEEELKVRERATVVPKETPVKHRRDPPTSATLLTGGRNTCCYCQRGHASEACRTVAQIEARKQILKRTGRCFVCLQRGHVGRECASGSRCTKCEGRHHVSICYGTRQADNGPSDTPSQPHQAPSEQTHPQSTSQPKPETTPSLYTESNKTVLLQTARATVFNPGNPSLQRELRLILDSGSQRSYITDQAKETLSLRPSGKRTMSIMTFGSTQERPQVCDVVRVGIWAKEGPDPELSLLSVPLICEPLAGTPVRFCIEDYDHLWQLDLADRPQGTGVEPFGPDILIGSDHYWDLITGETVRGSRGGPVALHTRIGWVLSGPITSPNNFQTQNDTNLITHVLRVGTSNSNERLNEQLGAFWELESLGISESESSVYEQFEKEISFSGGRYEVSLPWKDPLSTLPDNYQLSSKRLQSLLRRLQQGPERLEDYNTIIQEQIESGIVEVVNNPEQVDGERVHYLPHHAVIRQDKETTKMRVVYDASARSDGPSLNDCLHVGPKFNQRILDILLRFRVHRYALIADIEKAFLMISVTEKDRDVLRFLWIKDVKKDPPELQVLRFTRVVFGVSSSPFLLNATIRHHLEGFQTSHPDLVHQLLQSIYVDDVVCGAGLQEAAYQLYVGAKGILREGGFNLRKFVTNSPDLQERINRSEESHTNPKDLGIGEETYAKATLGKSQRTLLGERKVLGVRWDVDSDQLVLNLEDIAIVSDHLEPTKRHIVSVVGRFYDPLGFVSPIVIRFKMLFKELCHSKLDWDQPITGELLVKWNSLIEDLRVSQPIRVYRCYLNGMGQPVKLFQLCGFCDASTGAYAAVVYLVLKTDTSCVTRFVCSKTRVSPMREQTIPRLELLSALLLARLIVSVTKSLESEIKLEMPVCYSDSKVALHWVYGLDKAWKPFVQNRVNEIRRLVPASQWKHCSGKSNPADIPSRGLTPSALAESTLWTNGPEWLVNAEDLEQEDQVLPMPEECISELKVKDREAVRGLLITEKFGVSQIMEIEKYSSLNHLLRVTGHVLRFIWKLRHPRQPEDPPSLMSQAEVLWIQEAQGSLAADKNFENWKKQLGLFLDSTGVWRCGGRLSNADLAYSVKHPVVLPRCHTFTVLVARQAHERVLHNGVKETLTEIRTRYWILKGRSFVRQLLHHCVLCRRFLALPYHAPPPPPLPPFRVKEEPPFSFTGVDYAGPLHVKMDPQTRGSGKVWICLYTCCVTRAVHLDVVTNLSAQAFIRCFKRFVARRGLPVKIISDNGKAFKAAAKIIQKILSHEDVAQHLSGLRIEWTFNIERAPWWGGVFERMIKSTKTCLRKTIGRAKLSHDELLTAVTEVEMIVNSRPISYVSPDDIEEPLTPSHLLMGRRVLSLPDNLYHNREEEYSPDTNPELLTKRMRHLNNILDRFWKRWRTEYLAELRESHRYVKKSRGTTQLSVGDIVVIHDDSKRRGFWNLGKVERTLPGRDGQVRGAVVRVYTGGKRSKLFQRPIQRLYPLEVNCHRESQSPRRDSSPTRSESRRPRRSAAFEARDRIVAQAL